MKQRLDKGIVELAIAELDSAGEKITIKRLAELTGYHKVSLQNQDYLRKYVAYRSPRAKLPEPWLQRDIGDSLEAYKEHILSEYFSSPETRKDVEADMLAEVDCFKPSRFNQAVNQLLVEGLLIENKYNGTIVTTKAQEDFDRQLESILNIQPGDNPFNEPEEESSQAEVMVGRIKYKPFVEEVNLKLDDGFEISMKAGEATVQLVANIMKLIVAETA
ncbi:hypothetical protein [Roseateles sp. PN1]|uniref:hypothetical protein n=1 Tax=Roseateles sp. PN1 TaxID=3137372 RepID=UPI00313922F6